MRGFGCDIAEDEINVQIALSAFRDKCDIAEQSWAYEGTCIAMDAALGLEKLM